MPTDDLSTLFVQQPTPAVRYGQGKILSWDPDTFAHRIEWNGVVLEDLPVLAGPAALSFTPGQSIGLLGFDPTGKRGITQWWVLSNLVLPGADNAAQAVAFMASGLAQSVIAQSVHTDQVATLESLSGSAGTDTGYTDLTTAGPSVTFTTRTGKWLLLLVAEVETSGDKTAARMGYVASGAQTIAAANARSSLVNYAAPGGGVQSAVYSEVRTGTPGEITVQAKYRMIAPAATFPGSASWANRTITVIAY